MPWSHTGLVLTMVMMMMAILIIASAMHRNTKLRQRYEDGLKELQTQFAGVRSERDRLEAELKITDRKLREAFVQLDRVERRLRLYEAGSPTIAHNWDTEPEPMPEAGDQTPPEPTV